MKSFGWTYGAAAALLASLVGHAGDAAAQDLTIVLPEQPANLEPCFSINSNIGRVLRENVVEGLTKVDLVNETVEPGLATEWSQVDETTWDFTLRDGVTFQDGAPLDADAVVASIGRQMGEAITCANNAKLGGLRLTAEATAPDTVRITSDKPAPILPTLMPLLPIVSPNTPADSMVNDPVGTGPYRLTGSTSEAIDLERNDAYWGDAPALASARYIWRGESAVRAAMISTGEADLTPDIAVQDATDPELDHAYLNSETSRIRIGTDTAPLDDRRVREALNLAIDWDGLRTLFGDDVLRASQLVVPGIAGHDDALVPYPYDPERARELLADAEADGVPTDTTIALIGRSGIYPNGNEAMEAMMAMWQEVGLDVDLTILDVAAWVDYDQKPFPEGIAPFMIQQQHDNASGDAFSSAYFYFDSDGQSSGLSDPEIDAMLDEAAGKTGEERAAMLREIFRVLHEDVIADIPMYHMVGYARIAPNVNWEPTIETNTQIVLSDITLSE